MQADLEVMIITFIDLNCINKDADPTINSVNVEHTPLYVGDTEKVTVTSNYIGQVQYKAFLFDGKVWSALSEGYGVAVDASIPFVLPETKQFKLGKYKLSVWVKRAGTEGVKINAAGLGSYDNYYLKELNCVNKKAGIIDVTSVSLNTTLDTLIIGASDTLIPTINPINPTNKAVLWTSSNPEIATVDNTGKVTAVSAGIATITVTTVDGNKTATCSVNSILENIVKFFPQLPDVPQPSGLIYKDNYVNGDFVFYVYDLKDFDSDAYGKLLVLMGGYIIQQIMMMRVTLLIFILKEVIL